MLSIFFRWDTIKWEQQSNKLYFIMLQTVVWTFVSFNNDRNITLNEV